MLFTGMHDVHASFSVHAIYVATVSFMLHHAQAHMPRKKSKH